VELPADCEQTLHFTFFALKRGILLLYTRTCLCLLFLDTSGIFDIYNANLMCIGPCIVAIIDEKKNQLDAT
jgi:hypothetical protein